MRRKSVGGRTASLAAGTESLWASSVLPLGSRAGMNGGKGRVKCVMREPGLGKFLIEKE